MLGWAAMLSTAVPRRSSSTISNPAVLIDMVQNNPGYPVGWQQTKYLDPFQLARLNYTGMTTTGEMSGTQAVDFHTLGDDFFPTGSKARRWLIAYKTGVHGFIDRAKMAGLQAYFFVDLLVFPSTVLKVWSNTTDGSGNIVWNDATRMLTSVLIDETFSEFPDVAGWIVRTGETYVYDTPYHVGNSPAAGNKTADLWVSFITFLREEVCVKHQKALFFRAWDNWPSEASYCTVRRLDPTTTKATLLSLLPRFRRPRAHQMVARSCRCRPERPNTAAREPLLLHQAFAGRFRATRRLEPDARGRAARADRRGRAATRV